MESLTEGLEALHRRCRAFFGTSSSEHNEKETYGKIQEEGLSRSRGTAGTSE